METLLSDWDSGVESWTESEGTCSSEQCEHYVERQSGEKFALFLEDWELARGGLELPHRPGYVVPGNA